MLLKVIILAMPFDDELAKTFNSVYINILLYHAYRLGCDTNRGAELVSYDGYHAWRPLATAG